MNFWEQAKKTAEMDEVSVTENGAVGHKTTGHVLLDLNFAVASLRSASEDQIREKFKAAYDEDSENALLWLFFARDPRGGLGERRLFRICAKWLWDYHQEILNSVVQLIPEYGRFDDWWNILPLDYASVLVQETWMKDRMALMKREPISLLAKWLPSINTSSQKSRRDARFFAIALSMTERDYRKALSEMRRYLDVTERKMSANQWEAIKYEAVPSRANLVYNSAFLKHDESRRRAYLDKVFAGEAKMNASVLFPHDIVHSYRGKSRVDAGLEAMWKSLPDTVHGNGSTIVVADGSASMMAKIGKSGVSALDVANALAIYFAERCSGAFKDRYITFSGHPQFVDLSFGENLKAKLSIAQGHNECANTNVKAVFELILETAIRNRMKQEDLPANILIISDMEFDNCAETEESGGWFNPMRKPTKTLFEQIEAVYHAAGYKMPRMVFWNVNSRTGTIPVRENDLGVALVSGFSPNICKMVMSGKTDPYECLLETLHSERYAPVAEAIERNAQTKE